MQYAYRPEDLVLVQTCPAPDKGYSAVYDLPAPKPWLVHLYAGDDDTFVEVGTAEHAISRVRINIWPTTLDDGTPTGGMSTIVVPYYQGQEDILNTVTFEGTNSVVAVLHRMGYVPVLPAN